MEPQNFVAGAWRPSRAAGRFVVRDPLEPARELGSWPRSGGEELALVREAWERPPCSWPLAERRAALARAAARLAADGACAAACAARLALEPDEWRAHAEGLEPPLDARGRETSEGVCLLAPHWSELVRGPWQALAGALLDGRRVLLFADERLPAASAALLAALLAEGVPSDALALLHGADAGLVEEALALPGARALVASGGASRLGRLRRAALRRGGSLELRLALVQGGERTLEATDDLERAACEVACDAFGRARALSGQLGGALARVVCPERRLSRFTALLLAELERSTDVARPLPFASEEEEGAARRARALGLDEGATAIFDATPLDAAGPARAHAAVFTNVEPTMELARLSEPAPVLRLLRTS